MANPRMLQLMASYGMRQQGKEPDPNTRPVVIDMTYGVSRLYLTVFSMRDPRFEGRQGEEPLLPVAFGLTDKRSTEDYE